MIDDHKIKKLHYKSKITKTKILFVVARWGMYHIFSASFYLQKVNFIFFKLYNSTVLEFENIKFKILAFCKQNNLFLFSQTLAISLLYHNLCLQTEVSGFKYSKENNLCSRGKYSKYARFIEKAYVMSWKTRHIEIFLGFE